MKRVSRRGVLRSMFFATVGGLFSKSGIVMNEKGVSAAGRFEPGYLRLHRSGELKRRGEELWSLMGECVLCPENPIKFPRCTVPRFRLLHYLYPATRQRTGREVRH